MQEHGRKLLSIIIPIYNAEKYIRQCVDSLLMQTYDNREIILVDDGSSDASPEICDSYAAANSFVVCVHKANGGCASARNEGLRIARGEYIAFVDADDVVDYDLYELLIAALEENDCDFAACAVCNEYIDRILATKRHEYVPSPIVRNNRESLAAITAFRSDVSLSGYVWNKVFRRSAIADVTFRDDIPIVDDLVFVWEVTAKNVDRACLLQVPMYHYRYILSSITKSAGVRKQELALRGWERILGDAKELGVYDDCMPSLGLHYIIWNLKVCESLLRQKPCNYGAYERARANIREYDKCIPLLHARHRSAAKAVLHSWFAYKIVGGSQYCFKRVFLLWKNLF